MAFKWKSPAEKAAEAAAAANWNNLVSKITEANPEAKAEDITPDSILESMEESTSGGDATELQSQLTEANTKVKEHEATIKTMESTIAEQKVKLGADGGSTTELNKGTDTETDDEPQAVMFLDSNLMKVAEESKALFNALPN